MTEITQVFLTKTFESTNDGLPVVGWAIVPDTNKDILTHIESKDLWMRDPPSGAWKHVAADTNKSTIVP